MKRTRVGLVAAMAAALMAMGCGKQQTEVAATETDATQAAAASVQGTSPALTASAQAEIAKTPPPSTEPNPVSADSLPPDVVASTSVTTVTPGEVIEITAQGSTDVVEVILSDGLKKTALTFDGTAKIWRGVYRIPMRTSTDRLGLSVTAKNDQSRWQRVWVFLKVERGGAELGKTDGC